MTRGYTKIFNLDYGDTSPGVSDDKDNDILKDIDMLGFKLVNVVR